MQPPAGTSKKTDGAARLTGLSRTDGSARFDGCWLPEERVCSAKNWFRPWKERKRASVKNITLMDGYVMRGGPQTSCRRTRKMGLLAFTLEGHYKKIVWCSNCFVRAAASPREEAGEEKHKSQL